MRFLAGSPWTVPSVKQNHDKAGSSCLGVAHWLGHGLTALTPPPGDLPAQTERSKPFTLRYTSCVAVECQKIRVMKLCYFGFQAIQDTLSPGSYVVSSIGFKTVVRLMMCCKVTSVEGRLHASMVLLSNLVAIPVETSAVTDSLAMQKRC